MKVGEHVPGVTQLGRTAFGIRDVGVVCLDRAEMTFVFLGYERNCVMRGLENLNSIRVVSLTTLWEGIHLHRRT